MTSRLPAVRRRRQLLDVALGLFADRGYHATSMNDIAVEAGVTKPVLYQHFASKRQLFSELLDEVGAGMQEAVTKAILEARSPREMVTLGFDAYFRFVQDNRDAFMLLYGGGLARDAEFADVVNRIENALAAQVADLIEIEGLSAGQRRVLGHGIVGMIEGASVHWLNDATDTDPGTLAAQLADLAWRGLRGVGP
ncbi:MAG TPA: TetR/AcrR family transcriptional regulator [Acidimicrobiales bacterium]